MFRNSIRLLPIVTQLSLVASGLLVTFGYPFLFGFEAYGAFASACALTFVVHRVVDLTLESMISDRPTYQIIAFSSSIFLFVLLFSYAIEYLQHLSDGYLQYILLFSLIYSTTVLNVIFKSGDMYKQVIFATGFLFVTFCIIIFGYFHGKESIAFLISMTNFVGATTGLVVIYPQIAKDFRTAGRQNFGAMFASLAKNIVDLPFRVAFASFNILLGFGVIVAVGTRYDDTQIGALRIFTAVILLGFSLTPLNPKSYYLLAEGVSTPHDLAPKLRPYAPAVFLALAGWVIVVCLVNLPISPTAFHTAGLALATYPAVLLLSALDKILLVNMGLRKAGVAIALYTALCVFGVLSVTDFEHAKQILVAFVIAYPVIMTALFCRSFLPIALVASLIAGCAATLLSLDAQVGLAGWIAILTIAAAVMAIWRWKLRP